MPGSGIDLIARLLAEGLSPRLGQPVMVENRGAGGMAIAGEAHASARPGETLLLAPSAIASTVPYTFEGRLPYDPEQDLLPLGLVASEFLCLAVTAASPARDVAGLVAASRAAPGALNWYSVPGFMELAFRLFLHRHGMDMPFVAYRGSPQAVIDLVAGRIQAAILPLTPALAAVRQGSIRALATTSRLRAPSLPDVSTMVEAAAPGLAYDPFTALFGWRGMPPGARERMAAALSDTLGDPAYAARLGNSGMQAQAGSALALAEVIAMQRSQVQTALRTVGPRRAG
ncbi:tripartite tricarboxylate transporter substrate binding protein [Roseomonas sp. HF4]|uniref:Bug family tripartite tricarboxylate transporter substrate binding protein n=1 Tax=Roseomonas sp. HF4 TaxID=2562313 RepID=UPI00210811B9|nr:tripartite tricarboxylate transporter substrate binding protein [Roseomonas sp. HF4]